MTQFPEEQQQEPENIPSINEKKIAELMKRLTDELRSIMALTAPNKGFERVKNKLKESGPEFMQDFTAPLGELAEVGEDEAVMESKRQDAASHRAAAALVDVYETLGEKALALAVTEIRNAQDKGVAPCFSAEVATLFAHHYKGIAFAGTFPDVEVDKKEGAGELISIKSTDEGIELEVPDNQASNDNESPAQQATKKPRKISNATWMGVALAATSALFAAKGHRDYKDAKRELRSAVRESIELRLPKTPKEDQQRRLMELQEIEIPELKEKVKDSVPGSLPYVGIGVGAIIALLGVAKPSQLANKLQEKLEKRLDNITEMLEKRIQKPVRDHIGDAREVLSTIDGVIADACLRSNPSIDLSELHRR